MKNVIILFDKSLIVSKSDFEIFKNENYYIDDGTTHFFSEEYNSLLVLDQKEHPVFYVNFQSVMFEGDQYFEINHIKHRLDKPLCPERNLPEAQKEVTSIIVRVFTLLDDVLVKRTQKNSIDMEFYKYLTYDKNNHLFDIAVSLEKRFSYLQFLPKLEYIFSIID